MLALVACFVTITKRLSLPGHCAGFFYARQRTKYTARRKQIWEAMNPEVKPEIQVAKVYPPELSVGYKTPPQQVQGFAAETAAITGQSKSSINQSLAVSNVLGGNTLDRLAGTSLDKGVELVGLFCDSHENLTR